MRDVIGSADATERISDALRRLLREANGRAMTIREMVNILHGRGLQFVVILLCLPFLAPVSIPGISIPFGLASPSPAFASPSDTDPGSRNLS